MSIWADACRLIRSAYTRLARRPVAAQRRDPGMVLMTSEEYDALIDEIDDFREASDPAVHQALAESRREVERGEVVSLEELLASDGLHVADLASRREADRGPAV